MNLTSVQMAGPQAKQMSAAILSCKGVTVTQQQETRRTPADKEQNQVHAELAPHFLRLYLSTGLFLP